MYGDLLPAARSSAIASAPGGRQRIRDAGGKSNPLGPACSRLPYRLAPASGCPRQESNLVLDLRGVACDPAHSEDMLLCCCRPFSTPPRSRTSSCRFEICRAVRHTCRAYHPAARPGIEPAPTASEADMLSGTPTGYFRVRADDWIRTSIIRFAYPVMGK
jgi:hypothetical protein